jgi:hypothetical protein
LVGMEEIAEIPYGEYGLENFDISQLGLRRNL